MHCRIVVHHRILPAYEPTPPINLVLQRVVDQTISLANRREAHQPLLSLGVGRVSVQRPTRLMKDARVRGSVPHVGLPAKLVDRGGHGKWVVDAGQGRDHRQVCQGVHEGVEEGQGGGP